MTPDYPEGIPGAICDAAIAALSDHRVSANGEAMSGQSENPRAVAGDNSGAVQDEPATRFAKDQLKAIVERIKPLDEESERSCECASRMPTNVRSTRRTCKR